MIAIIGIGIIAGSIAVVTWWVYSVDKREREEQAAAYKEIYEKLKEKQES